MITREEIQKEAGDFSWYLVNTANELGIVIDTKIGFGNPDAVDMITTIAQFQEKMKKLYRDKDWVLDKKDIKALEILINRMYGGWLFVIKQFGFKPTDVYEMNIDKLFSRKARGKIHGEGDNR